MPRNVTAVEARSALDTIERGRLRVVDEIALPVWYWWGLALGWIGLGVLTDLRIAWLSSVATFAFGAIHAAVAPRVINGRRGNRALSVSAEVVGRQVPRLVIGGLVALTGLTVGLALAAQADGARHPVTAASIVVAVVILLGGTQLLARVRGAAVRDAEAS